jgi:HK97 family phage major capsid protein
MSFYTIGERVGMTVRRLNELYAGTGQVGILASIRVGGAVTQAEAFKHLVHPTTTA